MPLISRLCTALVCTMLLLAPTVALAGFAGPVDLIPTQSPLPEPWPVLKVLLLVTFALHLLLVNTLIGSCVMALAGSFRQNSGPPFNMKNETSFIPKVLALAVNLGVAPYLFMQVLYGNFFYPSTLLMAALWMGVVGLVLFSYYGLYIISDKSAEGISQAKPILIILTLMLLCVAFILTNNSTLMLRPENWVAWIHSPAGTVVNWSDPTLVPRYLHFLVASIAVGGLVHAAMAQWGKKKSADSSLADEKITRGLRWFRHATIVQIIVGVWFFLSIPQEVRKVFMGGSAIATTTLILALAGAVFLLVLAYRKQVWALCAVTATQVLVMVVVRDILRDLMLAPYLSIVDSPQEIAQSATPPLALAEGQHIAFGFFLFCTALAVFLIVWMARAVLKSMREHNMQKAGVASIVEE